jgi:hypothetical protein
MVQKLKDKPWEKALKALAEVNSRTAKERIAKAEANLRIYPKDSKAVPKTKVGDISSIASPLVEKEGSRTYHQEQVMWSSDGYFSFVWKPLKEVTFVDRGGQEIVFEFLEPSEDED